MAKKKDIDRDSDIDDILGDTHGGQRLEEVGTSSYFIDTGNLALNYICSGRFLYGGLPGGRITEIYGPPATAKSLLADCCLGACQRAGGYSIKLDCERASNAKFAAEAAHVDPRKLLVYEPPTLEEVERKIVAVVKAIRKHKGPDVPICFSWDSITVSMCERELRELDLPEEFTEAEFKRIVGGNAQPGERAKVAGNVLRRLNPFLNDHNATLIVINQVRSAIGVLYGNPEVTGGGGKALEYYASCRLRTSAKKSIEDGLGIPLGINLKFKNKKNRSHTPFLETEDVQLFYQYGINPLGGLLTTLLGARRITGGKGNYQVAPEYSDGKEVKFKASAARNEVPVETLYNCPALVGASSEKEIRDYINIFDSAIKVAGDESNVETETDSN